jgi:hypothetical protein
MMKKTAAEADAAGFDAGRNGANLTNCHFAFFLLPELTRAWESGYARAKGDRSRPHVVRRKHRASL